MVRLEGISRVHLVPPLAKSRISQNWLPKTTSRGLLAICHLSGQPVSGLSLPSRDKVSPDVQRKPPVFQFVSMVSRLLSGYHWKEPGLWRGLTLSKLDHLGKMLAVNPADFSLQHQVPSA